MNYKKVNWYFLGVIMLHLAVVGVLIALQNVYQMGMAVNLLVSELIPVSYTHLTLPTICSV